MDHNQSSWRLADRPLQVQFLAAGGVVALFSFVSLFLLLSQVNRQTEASHWLASTHRVIGYLNTLGRDFYQQETALRDFIRTENLRFVASFKERQEFWHQSYEKIKELSQFSAKNLEEVENIRQSYEDWSAYSEKLLLVTMQHSNGMSKGFTPQELADRLREESRLFKETFVLIDQLSSAQSENLSDQDQAEKKEVQSTFSTIAIINIALLLIFSIVLVKLYVSIARPIADLSQAIGQYREGDFSTRVVVSNSSQIGFLEGSFNELAERIESMVADLKKLDELKSDFLSTVSHELRTPLTSIGGYVKLLISEDAGPISSTQREFLNVVDINVQRLALLINDILDVEKIESGKIQLVKEPQDLTSILKECFSTLQIVGKQKNLEMRYKVPEISVDVLGDRSRLVQVFMNLLSNAIKYTKQGFVELIVEPKEYAVLVRVKDSGVGVSPEDLDKIFQKFYRTRSALTSSEGGTGLGLVIVRGLVEAHGGQITVESKLGAGTTFTVSLPILKKEAQPSQERFEQEPKQKTG